MMPSARILSTIILTLLVISCASPKTESTKPADSTSKETTSLVDSVPKAKTDPLAIPQGIKVNGELYSVKKWTDKNGENVLVLSFLSASKEDKEADMTLTTKELFAELYVKEGTEYKQLWKLYDLVKECPFDVSVEFLGQPDVTDLDNDNEKEVFVNYKVSCRSDVSPSTLKIIGHEGKTKFGLRGPMWVKMAEDEVIDENMEPDLSKLQDADGESSFGRFENANDFKNQPKEFLDFARKNWVMLREESF